MAQTAAKQIENPDAAHQPGRGRIYNFDHRDDRRHALVRLKKIAKERGVKANLLAKLEFFNPIASVKDRIGVHMISVMEASARSLPAKQPSSSRRPAIPASRSPSSRRRAAISSSW